MAARDTRHATTWGTRFRMLVRMLGMTGVLAAVVGAALFASAFPSSGQWNADTLKAAAEGSHGGFAKNAALILVGGVGAVAVALLVEVVGGLFLVTGRRTAANTTSAVGTLAALALLVFVNAYSFTHSKRYDFTREKKFTLPPELADRLRSLRPESPTTIVVLQNHNLFGSLSTSRDAFTKAAEEKVTEKVKDLVDLFREFGPRFNVAVLDTEAFSYKKQLEDLTKDAPELKAAIEAAPENSIFFHANKRVQRLAFNEFLQLDKTSSREANDGRGNLVLLPQGVESFARRVLAVQEKRPKVAVCVVHEWFTTLATQGQEEMSLAGLKKSLTAHGFEVVDIVLKRNWPGARQLADLEPAAYTLEESALERLEGDLSIAASRGRVASRQVMILDEVRKDFDASKDAAFRDRGELYEQLSLAAQTQRWVEIASAVRKWAEANGSPRVTAENEAGLRAALDEGLKTQALRAAEEVKDAEKARREADDRVKAAYKDERSTQDRRERDVKAKFARLLSDVDLLVIPRSTLINATTGNGTWAAIHTLSKEHVEVIKDFMKRGKPVLACLGSVSGEDGPDDQSADGVERLIAERGIELGRDTVLFDAEQRAFADMLAGGLLGGGSGDLPPLVFADKSADAPKAGSNPVGAAVKLTGRSVDQKLDLVVRAPRPVYLTPAAQERMAFASEFVLTSPDSWNEERPYPTRAGRGRVAGVPRFEPTLPTDRNWNTRRAERKGPFPIGVAVEGKIPAAWVDEEYEREQFAAGVLTPIDGVMAAGLTAAAAKLDRPTQRLVVFGSGNLFTGATLDPAKEKLLLHSANWLTGRDERLPQAELAAWQFPRVEMTEREVNLWRWGTAVGLPLLAVYVGLLAMMLRRLR